MTTMSRILRQITVFGIPMLLAGCSWDEGIFAPAGPVASAQKSAFFWIVALKMIVIVPMIIALPLVLWRYRLRNDSVAQSV
jgi:cytochrome o ubiquinol oxidase subunit 2